LVSAIAIRLRHSAPWFAAGWLWYLITLLPVLGLVQSGAQASVDHYLYIPLVGLFIVVAWGGAAASSQWPRARRMALVTAAGICLFHAVIARQLVGSWRTTETLFDRALYVNPANYIVWTMLGTLDEEKGRMADAHAAFETSIQLRPDYLPAYEALADWYKGQKQPAEALQLRESAVQLDQDSAQAWESLGVALYEAGRFDEAWDKLLKAASLLPGDPHTHAMMGSTLIAKGSVLAGLDEYDQAVARDPFDGLNRRLIGRFWQSTGPRGIEQVVDAFRHAVAADPLDAVNHASLGNALAETPDGREEAIRELRVAQKLHWDAGVDASLQRLNAGSPAK
jgi:tetratricopeptide (TPR) repeat protein